jgi:hypothetical protein
MQACHSLWVSVGAPQNLVDPGMNDMFENAGEKQQKHNLKLKTVSLL